MKATDRWGIFTAQNPWLKVSCARLPPSEASPFSWWAAGAKQSERSGAQAALDGFANKEGVGEMQMRSTNLDHHHQEGLVGSARSSPEADLLALARSKGQPLTEHTLRLIRETLELRGVSLEAFVADVRPHFRNNILNPSGFLINRARRFHELARPAQVRVAATTAGRRQRNYARFAKVRNLSSERRKSSLAQHAQPRILDTLGSARGQNEGNVLVCGENNQSGRQTISLYKIPHLS
jgi:hypothetical protein